MERKIEFSPAFDKRHPEPRKNYGIHGVEMKWYLIGELGSVQFVVYTNWQLPHVREQGRKSWRDPCLFEPRAYDLGYHSPKPMYEGQTAMCGPGECHVLPKDCSCYYDGSSLNCEPVFETLIREGHDACWKELEDYYVSTFGELK